MSYTGKVQNGVVVLPPEVRLPEGTEVQVVPLEASAESRTLHEQGPEEVVSAVYPRSSLSLLDATLDVVLGPERQFGGLRYGTHVAYHAPSFVGTKRQAEIQDGSLQRTRPARFGRNPPLRARSLSFVIRPTRVLELYVL